MSFTEFDSKLKSLLRIIWHCVLLVALVAIVVGFVYTLVIAIFDV